ncbi:cupin domain-containing protein [Alphaproteobacteria bacterium]|nr:cupin domain-containing protein [Alphaproteobacteria bacterium]
MYSFEDLLNPFNTEEFFALFHDKKHLHVPDDKTNRFSELFNWGDLNNILSITQLWTASSLKLVLDKVLIKEEEYCNASEDLFNQGFLRPDPILVKKWLQKGATLVINDVDTLHPNIENIAKILENRLSAKVQCNIYFSIKGHQGFDVHFDVHEVFALHLIGEKEWNLYSERLDNPINNEYYQSLDENFCKQNSGEILSKVRMKPGDLLYIPRGQFHEAKASSSASVHLTFSVTHLIGHDFMSLIFEKALTKPDFRSNFPLDSLGKNKQIEWIDKLANQVSSIARSDELKNLLFQYSNNFYTKRDKYNFPTDLKSDKNQSEYRLASNNFKLKSKNNSTFLQINNKALKIPEIYKDAVSMIINMKIVNFNEVNSLKTKLTEPEVKNLIQDLVKMKVLLKTK